MVTHEFISIIIPSNVRPCLHDALHSIQATPNPIEHEVLVVGAWPDSGPAPTEPIRFIPCEGLGTGAMRNLAAREARGDILLFTDSDCIVDPDWMEGAKRALSETRPIVAGGLRFPENNKWDLGDNLAIFHTVHVSQKPGLAKGHVGTNNLAVRREVFEALGGFDDQLTVGEDGDFLDRARRAGYPIGFDPSFAVRHQSGRDTPALVQAHAKWYAEGYAGLLAEKHIPTGRWRAERWIGSSIVLAKGWSGLKATLAVIRIVLPHPPFWRYLRGVPGAWLFYYTRRVEVFRQINKS